jgi:DEAD/DEAH box helicase domain-containing protein
MSGPVLAFDIETQKLFEEIKGGTIKDLLLAIAVTVDVETGERKTFHAADHAALIETLYSARLVVGFNHLAFDFRVLEGYGLDARRITSFDVMMDLVNHVKKRVSLDSLARGTIGQGKSGKGTDAPMLFRTGQLEALEHYCRQDVFLLIKVFEAGFRTGRVSFMDKVRNSEVRRPVNVHWSCLRDIIAAKIKFPPTT